MNTIDLIHDILIADATISGLIGTNVYPYRAHPDDPIHSIVVTRAGERSEYALQGYVGFNQIRVSLSCRGTTQLQAETLGDAVDAALRDYNQTFSGEEVVITKEGMDVSDASEDNAIFRRILDYYVRHRTAA